jgi:hypothetical protein
MNVESALRVLTRIPELNQVEDRLDVRIESVIALACKGNITESQFFNCLLGVFVLEMNARGSSKRASSPMALPATN